MGSEQEAQESWEEMVTRLQRVWGSTRQRWSEVVHSFAEDVARSRGEIVEGSVMRVEGDKGRLVEGDKGRLVEGNREEEMGIN